MREDYQFFECWDQEAQSQNYSQSEKLEDHLQQQLVKQKSQTLSEDEVLQDPCQSHKEN